MSQLTLADLKNLMDLVYGVHRHYAYTAGEIGFQFFWLAAFMMLPYIWMFNVAGPNCLQLTSPAYQILYWFLIGTTVLLFLTSIIFNNNIEFCTKDQKFNHMLLEANLFINVSGMFLGYLYYQSVLNALYLIPITYNILSVLFTFVVTYMQHHIKTCPKDEELTEKMPIKTQYGFCALIIIFYIVIITNLGFAMIYNQEISTKSGRNGTDYNCTIIS
jgi:hypothetical protein